jgi:hypothetical protein
MLPVSARTIPAWRSASAVAEATASIRMCICDVPSPPRRAPPVATIRRRSRFRRRWSERGVRGHPQRRKSLPIMHLALI